MIDPKQIDSLKQNRDLLVRALEEAGAKVTGASVCCPFHQDNAPSGSIHQEGEVWLYTCHGCTWNSGKVTGDVLAVVQVAQKCDFKTAAQHLGLTDDGQVRPVAQRSAIDLKADQCHERLMADDKLLDRLWRERAVTREVVQRFRVGVDEDRRYWVFPITSRNGRVEALKKHRIDPSTMPKCMWEPKGVKRDHCWPVGLSAPGVAWLCSGELKALAVISAGGAAVGITSGEGNEKSPAELPDAMAGILAGREVGIATDADATGAAWGKVSQQALLAGGIETRLVDLKLDKAVGLKDVGDWVVSSYESGHDPEQIVANLKHAFDAADRWHAFSLGGIIDARETWAPVEHIPSGFTELDADLGGGLRTRSVHLLAGLSGRGKSQTAVAMAVNAARMGYPVGFVSLELERRDVGQLITSQIAGVPRSDFANGVGDRRDADRIRLAKNVGRGLPLCVLDDEYWIAPLTRTRLAALVAAGKQRFGWKLLVVDYLGLVVNEETDRSDYAADCANSAALKRIARRNDLALVGIVAVRKRKAADADKPIVLDDVTGAARICYDAVNVFGVQPSGCKDREPDGIELTPLKTRFSRLQSSGKVIRLDWMPMYGAVKDPGVNWHWQNLQESTLEPVASSASRN